MMPSASRSRMGRNQRALGVPVADGTEPESPRADVAAGRPVELSFDDFPCFTAEALEGRAHVTSAALAEISAGLTPADACVFERAAKAIDEGDLAWIGFKYVYDASAACENVDNEVTKKYGDVGSGCGDSFVFFCNDAKEIVCGREHSPRDIFQMKDATRGPAMHTEQFGGLTWLAVALFDKVRVWLLCFRRVGGGCRACAPCGLRRCGGRLRPCIHFGRSFSERSSCAARRRQLR